MNKYHRISVTLLLLALLFLPVLAGADSDCRSKRIIGMESWVHVRELGLNFLARVDTGATVTSLHANDFLIIDGTDDHRDNVGKTINFLTQSTNGEYKRLQGEIAKVQTVRTAQGKEKRYMVWLTLTARGVTKRVLVNLRDRSKMRYKLLIGRDWLSHDFLVDVDLKADKSVIEGEEE